MVLDAPGKRLIILRKLSGYLTIRSNSHSIRLNSECGRIEISYSIMTALKTSPNDFNVAGDPGSHFRHAKCTYWARAAGRPGGGQLAEGIGQAFQGLVLLFSLQVFRIVVVLSTGHNCTGFKLLIVSEVHSPPMSRLSNSFL
jgi:hypothetical protein